MRVSEVDSRRATSSRTGASSIACILVGAFSSLLFCMHRCIVMFRRLLDALLRPLDGFRRSVRVVLDFGQLLATAIDERSGVCSCERGHVLSMIRIGFRAELPLLLLGVFHRFARRFDAMPRNSDMTLIGRAGVLGSVELRLRVGELVARSV